MDVIGRAAVVSRQCQPTVTTWWSGRPKS